MSIRDLPSNPIAHTPDGRRIGAIPSKKTLEFSGSGGGRLQHPQVAQ